MTEINGQQIRVNSEQLLKLSILFDKYECKEISLTFDGISEIIASTEGTIKENEVFLKRKQKMDVFVKPSYKTVSINTAYLSGDKVLHCDNNSIESNLIRKEKECKPLVIFTGNKKTDVFEEKIKNRLMPDWNVSFEQNDESIIIKIENNKVSTLVCFGVLLSTVTAQDISFVLDADIKIVTLPWDFLLHHFAGQKVALHLLVKPDFQKRIDNIYYKSQISDTVKIPDEKTGMRRLSDFSSPVGPLDASMWIMNYETQLPEFLGK